MRRKPESVRRSKKMETSWNIDRRTYMINIERTRKRTNTGEYTRMYSRRTKEDIDGIYDDVIIMIE